MATTAGRGVAALAHPGVGLLAYAAVVVGANRDGAVAATMRHPWLRDVEPWVLVAAGLLFFAPLVGEIPLQRRLAAPLRMTVLSFVVLVHLYAGVVVGQTAGVVLGVGGGTLAVATIAVVAVVNRSTWQP